MKEVIVVVGAGQIGQAIARRVSVGKHVLLADMRKDNANAAAEIMSNAGYDVSVTTVDASSREAVEALVKTASGFGEVTGLIHSAGVSPTQASPATILKVDLYGTALVLEEFGKIIARGGSGVVIASQSGHRLGPLTVEQNKALATTPVEQLLALPFLSPERVTDSLNAYQLAKRGNALRVMAEAVRWGKRGARINTISPGIIFTPLESRRTSSPVRAAKGIGATLPGHRPGLGLGPPRRGLGHRNHPRRRADADHLAHRRLRGKQRKQHSGLHREPEPHALDGRHLLLRHR
jgi:NAD(P)-dependent dehydrogenase (short-subunit alcohol dehydrogenase family)